MSNAIYNPAKVSFLKGELTLVSGTIKAMLLTHSYTPNIDTQQFVSDISANEVSTGGTGYTRQTLTTKAVVQDSSNDRAYFDADDIIINNTTIPDVRYIALFQDTGSDATSRLIGYIDLGATKSTVAETFYLQFVAVASGAILYLS